MTRTSRMLGIALAVLLTSCGGRGRSTVFVTGVVGHWEGPIRQSGCARCGDGTDICVGAGFLLGNAAVDINVVPNEAAGTEEVSLAYSDCLYKGTRTQQREVTLLGQDSCSGTIELSDIEFAAMQMRLLSPRPSPSEPFGCAVNEWIVLSRK